MRGESNAEIDIERPHQIKSRGSFSTAPPSAKREIVTAASQSASIAGEIIRRPHQRPARRAMIADSVGIRQSGAESLIVAALMTRRRNRPRAKRGKGGGEMRGGAPRQASKINRRLGNIDETSSAQAISISGALIAVIVK